MHMMTSLMAFMHASMHRRCAVVKCGDTRTGEKAINCVPPRLQDSTVAASVARYRRADRIHGAWRIARWVLLVIAIMVVLALVGCPRPACAPNALC